MNDALDKLARDYWDYALSTSPTEALLLGDHRKGDSIHNTQF